MGPRSTDRMKHFPDGDWYTWISTSRTTSWKLLPVWLCGDDVAFCQITLTSCSNVYRQEMTECGHYAQRIIKVDASLKNNGQSFLWSVKTKLIQYKINQNVNVSEELCKSLLSLKCQKIIWNTKERWKAFPSSHSKNCILVQRRFVPPKPIDKSAQKYISLQWLYYYFTFHTGWVKKK